MTYACTRPLASYKFAGSIVVWMSPNNVLTLHTCQLHLLPAFAVFSLPLASAKPYIEPPSRSQYCWLISVLVVLSVLLVDSVPVLVDMVPCSHSTLQARC